jgi:hypothetical protein
LADGRQRSFPRWRAQGQANSGMLRWSGFDEVEPFFDAQDTLVHTVKPVGDDRILLLENPQAAFDFLHVVGKPIDRRSDGAQMLEDEIFGCL